VRGWRLLAMGFFFKAGISGAAGRRALRQT
jgi:hypothetical protein